MEKVFSPAQLRHLKTHFDQYALHTELAINSMVTTPQAYRKQNKPRSCETRTKSEACNVYWPIMGIYCK